MSQLQAASSVRLVPGHAFRLVHQLALAYGFPRLVSLLLADSLTEASLRGIDSHGLALLPDYITLAEQGKIRRDKEGKLATKSGACAVYDGEHGPGQLVAYRCCWLARELAKQYGVCFVVARNSSHFGAAFYWAELLAGGNLLGLVFSNAAPRTPPWGGRDPRLGTNPLAVALPGGQIYELDMATTAISIGKLLNAAFRGEVTIPLGWALSKEGLPTTDLQEALGGYCAPLGNYKGTGLQVFIELITGVLGGGEYAWSVGSLRYGSDGPMHISHAFIAVDLRRFLPLELFLERAQRLVTWIKSSRPAPGVDEILVAGEPERRTRMKRMREGIPVPLPVWQRLVDLAMSTSVREIVSSVS